MLHLVEPVRAYPPETVLAMTTAFDSAVRSLPEPLRESGGAQEALARAILRLVDCGEHDADRLADFALREILRSG